MFHLPMNRGKSDASPHSSPFHHRIQFLQDRKARRFWPMHSVQSVVPIVLGLLLCLEDLVMAPWILIPLVVSLLVHCFCFHLLDLVQSL